MNERIIRLATICGYLAVVGAIIGYLREASFSGTIAGAIFFVVVWGFVALLMTDRRSLAR
jgi:uncharacterized membrane protein (UPF0136 family)